MEQAAKQYHADESQGFTVQTASTSHSVDPRNFTVIFYRYRGFLQQHNLAVCYRKHKKKLFLRLGRRQDRAPHRCHHLGYSSGKLSAG